MTGQNILDKFANYVSDSLDQDFLIQLVNDAKNAIETELEFEITKKLDSTGTTSSGQTSTTARSLPSDFFTPLNIYVGTDLNEPIPFEYQPFYKDTAGKYWIDLASNQYHLCGTQGSTQTIYFFYQYQTTDLATGTLSSWTPVWPSRFHSIIPLEMARQYFQIDQSERWRSWDDKYQADYDRAKRLLIQWDHKLKLNAIDRSATLEDLPSVSENRINLP